jgi:hypothetical protein
VEEFVVFYMKDPTPSEEEKLQLNGQTLNVIYETLDPKIFKTIKYLEFAHQVWKRLEDSFEGTPVVKEAKLYRFKDKYAKFKMQEDDNVPKMFHRLNVIVNELRNLGHKVDYEDFSYRFLRCLPPRFDTLVTIIVRGDLKGITPTQVLGDVVTQDTYRVEREGVDKEDEKKKKKSVAFKRYIIKGQEQEKE